MKQFIDGQFTVEGNNDFRYSNQRTGWWMNLDELIFLAIPTVVLLTALLHLMIDWLGLIRHLIRLLVPFKYFSTPKFSHFTDKSIAEKCELSCITEPKDIYRNKSTKL